MDLVPASTGAKMPWVPFRLTADGVSEGKGFLGCPPADVDIYVMLHIFVMCCRFLPSTPMACFPPGDYELTLDELRACSLVTGNGVGSSTWNSVWRASLVENFAVLVGQLHRVGVVDIFADGSFVEDKDHPNDIDGYFVCDLRRLASGDLQRELNLLDPHKVWTWDPSERRPFHGYPKKQLPMWHQYRVELYPHYGQLSGIRDAFGNELEFPSAFRVSRRDGKPRGIIKIGGPS